MSINLSNISNYFSQANLTLAKDKTMQVMSQIADVVQKYALITLDNLSVLLGQCLQKAANYSSEFLQWFSSLSQDAVYSVSIGGSTIAFNTPQILVISAATLATIIMTKYLYNCCCAKATN